MEIRLRKGGGSSSTQDELAIVKAAAWAWYQHGSGGKGEISVREFDARRTHREPRPSRYRLEAVMRRAERVEALERCDSVSSAATSDSNGAVVLLSPTKTDMSLFDAYEIQRISMQLDRIMESSRRFSFEGGEYRPEISPPHMPEIDGRNRPRKKKSGRFLFRHAVAVCGGSKAAHVFDPAAVIGRRRGIKYVEEVRLQNCRPRAHVVSDQG